MPAARLFQYGGVRYRRTASAADRAVLVELRRFLAVIHAICTVPSGPRSIGTRERGPSRLSGRSRTGSTGSRCVAAHRRFWTRHGSSRREPVRFCFPIGSANSLRRNNCGGCSRSTGSQPCRTVSGPASGTGRPRRRIIPARSSKRPSRMWYRTGSRRQTPTVLDVYVIIELTGFAGRIPAN